MEITYESNNSGGGWWLKDEDWKALEKAGWKVKWFKDQEASPLQNKRSDRWLGALAEEATKEFDSIREAIQEFEKITGQDVSDEGCNCCGAPHNFIWKDDKGYFHSCSGQSCLDYMYYMVPSSLRDACS